MGENILQDVRELLRRVTELEARLEIETAARVKATNAFLYQLRMIRAKVVKQETYGVYEKWHVGDAYTLGSRLLIPGRPKTLRARWYVEKLKKTDISTIRVLRALEEVEGLTDGSWNGVPRSV